jgi:hypothetical protein
MGIVDWDTPEIGENFDEKKTSPFSGSDVEATGSYVTAFRKFKISFPQRIFNLI